MPRAAVFLVLTAALLAACAARTTKPDGDVSALVKTEASFCKLAGEKGVKEAFLTYLGEGAVMFDPGPVEGRKLYEARPAKPGLLTWEPSGADVSSSGDLGYTYGVAKLTKGGAPEESAYLHIWRREAGGSWKLVLDLTNPIPPPKS